MTFLYWLYLWQLKEYRPDRMMVFLNDLSPLALMKALFIGQKRKPVVTRKMIGIILISLVCSIVWFDVLLLVSSSIAVALLGTYALIPASVSLAVLSLYFPSQYFAEKLIQQATRKRERFPGLQVIVITGSYGKTTTKEAIAAVLSEKFIVLKTPGGMNVDVAIAKLLLDQLTDKIQFLVVEAGAYKEGEIAKIMSMVQPQMGVLTGINEQHLELFGGIEHTIAAKFEVVTHLRSHGVAVLNVANQLVNEHKGLVGNRKLLTYTSTTPSENKNASIVIGQHFGVPEDQISKVLKELPATERRMESKTGRNGVRLIDNTYNSNPTGFRAAIGVLTSMPVQKRIIITTGVYELGAQNEKIHTDLFNFAHQSVDVLYLVEPAHNVSLPFVELVTNEQEMINLLIKDVGENTAILLDGRHRIINQVKEFLLHG